MSNRISSLHRWCSECTSTHRVTSHQPGSCEERSSVVTHYSPSMEPTGTHDSSIHGSVPCSSWEIISGLETWSPAQRGKKRNLSATRKKHHMRTQSRHSVGYPHGKVWRDGQHATGINNGAAEKLIWRENHEFAAPLSNEEKLPKFRIVGSET